MRMGRVLLSFRRSPLLLCLLRSEGFATGASRRIEARVESGVEWSLRHECRVKSGDSMVAMVSGGSDSVALLHALCAVRRRWEPPLALEVVHFDHGLRRESKGDARFVEALCERLGVECLVETWPPPGSVVLPTQATARRWRRGRALARNASVVVLAHHADDQVETALLRLARGARLSKVFAGMRPYAKPFARPLLSFAKADLVAYLEAMNETWREDASNEDPSKYARNFVRLEIVPRLADLAARTKGTDQDGALRRRVAALARQSEALDRWLGTCADDLQATRKKKDHDEGLDVDGWADVPEPLRHELLSRLVCAAGGTASFSHLVDLDDALLRDDDDLLDDDDYDKRRRRPKKNWNRDFPGNVVVRRRVDGLDARRKDDVGGEEHVLRVDDDLQVSVSQRRWHLRAGRGRPVDATLEESIVRLKDLPRPSTLELRRRRDGDRFHPPWRSHPIKLKDFLRGQKVPSLLRDDVPVLCRRDDLHQGEPIIAVLLDPPCIAPQWQPNDDDDDDDSTWLAVARVDAPSDGGDDDDDYEAD